MAVIQYCEFPLIDFCGRTNIILPVEFVVFLNRLSAALLCPRVLDNRARSAMSRNGLANQGRGAFCFGRFVSPVYS